MMEFFQNNLVNWLILVAVIGYFWMKFMPGIFGSRRQRIQSAIDEAIRTRQEGEAFLLEQKERIVNAEKEAELILVEARQQAAQIKQQMADKTKQDVADLAQKLEQQIATHRQLVITELRAQAAVAAVRLAEASLPGAITPTVKKGLQERFVTQLDQLTWCQQATTVVDTTASHYADAIMQLARDTNADKTVLENLRAVKEVLKLNPEFATVLRHPAVSTIQKKQLIISTFGGKVHELTLRLLELLTDRRRLMLIPHIEAEYDKLWREQQNIATGTLFYAEKPEARVLTEIKTRLQTELDRTIELSEEEDKSLLGGFLLRVGDQIIDGSLKGRLQAIEQQLLSV